MNRFAPAKKTYDQADEAGFRRAVEESFQNANTAEITELRIGGGLLYTDSGALKFKSRNNTVTTLALL